MFTQGVARNTQTSATNDVAGSFWIVNCNVFKFVLLTSTWFLPCWLAMVLEVFGVGDSGDDNWCLAEAVAVVVLCATDGSSGRVGK
ncbi:hypothetical protein QYF36_006381 [Acer negundo]|nr:hypothetical protein QYF36_006381 [Acer negundo]